MKINSRTLIALVVGIVGIPIVLASIGLDSVFSTDGSLPALIVGGVSILFISALLYFLFIRPSMNYSRLMKTGMSATGRIISISKPKGRSSNAIRREALCSIKLQVEIPGQPTYITTIQSLIPYYQAEKLEPDMEVPILVDSANLMKVVVVRNEELTQDPLKTIFPDDVKSLQDKFAEIQKENEVIKSTGTRSKAIVKSYSNLRLGSSKEYRLTVVEVQVIPDNEPAFYATIIGLRAYNSKALYMPRKEIFVKFDPTDKTRVTIEHS